MKKDLTRPDGSVFITLSEDEDNKWIFFDWQGYLDVDLVKQGSEEGLKMMKNAGFKKMLIDNSHIMGSWHKVNDWYVEDWNPRAVMAGLMHMSVVVSPNIFSQLSLQNFEKKNNSAYIVRSFKSMTQAKSWLMEQ